MAEGAPSPAPARAEILAWLVETLTGIAPGPAAPVTEATPLADGGLCLDSMALVELVAAIERRFRVGVSDEEISPEHLDTVGLTLRFVEAKLAARGGPA